MVWTFPQNIHFICLIILNIWVTGYQKINQKKGTFQKKYETVMKEASSPFSWLKLWWKGCILTLKSTCQKWSEWTVVPKETLRARTQTSYYLYFWINWRFNLFIFLWISSMFANFPSSSTAIPSSFSKNLHWDL